MSRKPMLTRADNYEGMWSQIDYSTLEIPETFNMGTAMVDDNDPATRALTIVHEDQTSTDYTFGDVREQCNRLANALIARGISAGDTVAIINPQSLETGVAFTGIWRMGAVALPISHLFGPDALAYRFTNSECKFVITTHRNEAQVREAIGDLAIGVFVIGGDDSGPDSWSAALAAASPDFTPVQTRSSDQSMLIYTSGTTGNPKGVVHAHRMVFGQIPIFEAAYDFFPEADDVLWSVADWAWIAGIMDILVPAWFYGLPVIVDEVQTFDPTRAVWLMREFKVSLSLLPATALRGIRAAGLAGGGFSFRALASGGEALGADLYQWANDFFGCDINDAYGQTEMNGLCCHSSKVYQSRPGSVGRAAPGNIVAVIDPDGSRLVNETGEIAVDRHHPLVMVEYWKNPEATAKKFNGDWLLTGDLGRMDDDGFVWFESRTDDLINTSGYRVGPTEIENCLGAHDEVAMSAVIGVPDERRGQAIRAFVVPRDGVEPNDALIDRLRQHVRSRLAAHEVPRDIRFVEELPRTATGKIMRRALRDDA